MKQREPEPNPPESEPDAPREEEESHLMVEPQEEEKAAEVDEISNDPPADNSEAAPSLEEEVARWKDLALRSRADLENYRKRMTAEKAEAIRYANQSLFESLLPVLDNFQFGLAAAREAKDASGVLLGMEMVEKQLEAFLADQNITEIPAEPGRPFDPKTDDAVSQEPHPAIPEGHVVKILRKGYRMGDRLIRAVNVVVSTGAGGGKQSEEDGA